MIDNPYRIAAPPKEEKTRRCYLWHNWIYEEQEIPTPVIFRWMAMMGNFAPQDRYERQICTRCGKTRLIDRMKR